MLLRPKALLPLLLEFTPKALLAELTVAKLKVCTNTVRKVRNT